MADSLSNLPASSSGVVSPNLNLEPIPESGTQFSTVSPQTSARPTSLQNYEVISAFEATTQLILPPHDALGKFVKRDDYQSSSSSKSKTTLKSQTGRLTKLRNRVAMQLIPPRQSTIATSMAQTRPFNRANSIPCWKSQLSWRGSSPL